MAYETFSTVLNAADFPFVSDFLTRTITIPGLDAGPRLPRDFSGTAESTNYEVSQVYYCQNVLPTTEGVQSVGYSQIVAGIGAADFDQVINLRDEDENNFLFSPAGGKNYIFRADAGVWVSHSPFVGWGGDIVSRAYVNGRTFVCYEQNSIWEYDTATDTFAIQAITGILATDIDVIGSSNNYLIAVVGITVHWSSLVDPLDFVPSRQTGAGNSIPQDMKGIARAIVAISGGFIIYTTKNAVLALYTNNAQAPFVFREVSNAGGVVGPEHVSLEATLGYHYAWTTNGLQKISVNGAESLSTAATDFLAGRIWEEFNIPAKTWTVQRLGAALQVKLSYISGRYLVISYGKLSAAPQLYTHALVFDTSLKRWGKLRMDHVDCFAYPYPNFIGIPTFPPSKESVGFLASNGTVTLLIMDYRERQDQGVLLLGRYQLVRQKTIIFQMIELEGEHQAYPCDVYLVVSVDGKTNGTPQVLQTIKDAGAFKTYGAPSPTTPTLSAQRAGKNVSFLVVGTFELSAGILTFTKGGNR